MLTSQQVLQASVTKTSAFNSVGVDLGADFAAALANYGTPATCDVAVTAIDRAQSDETYVFTLQHSDDNVTFVACGGPGVSPTATGTVRVSGFVNKRYVRLALVTGGSTPSITYSAALDQLDQSAAPGLVTLSPAPNASLRSAFSGASVSVTLASDVKGAKIFYTTDGSDPRPRPLGKGALYAGALTVAVNTQVRAIAIASGYVSDVAVCDYVKTV